MGSRQTPFQCFTLALLVIPPLLLTAYFLAAFPKPPGPIHVHSSLASLPKTAMSWSIYPEDLYPGGAYAELPFGRVRYWQLGPESGRKIVLIHGLSIPAIIWKDIAPALASNGYRVMLYDLYGRGYSDAPQTTYDPTLYTVQLALLMQHVRWEKAIICGVSMGGGIAAAFTSQFPNLVDENVVLIASAGIMESSDISRTAKFMSSPLVQTFASSGPVRHYIQRLANKSSTSIPAEPLLPLDGEDTAQKVLEPLKSESVHAAVEIVRLQSAHLPGYNAALSSSLRDGPIRGQKEAFASKGFEGKRVLLIHGTKDATVKPEYSPKILQLLPPETRKRSKLVRVEGAGHDVTLSHPERVGGAMWAWFEGREEV
ncbi:alpha/beta-hydrolase [Coprinopsis marcescibilis]|uniref:Alpha/beta-hydrolase n=1 Tax=Coprinopsis marcescibilis TaxID=230819 RepID=A0A5C3LAH4_COPMA|nr:alpha/beta-hydrolase [Coprinopsis marcescibilis]